METRENRDTLHMAERSLSSKLVYVKLSVIYLVSSCFVSRNDSELMNERMRESAHRVTFNNITLNKLTRNSN